MSSYGYSYVFFGWKGKQSAESALTALLAAPTTLPTDFDEDEYDEPPELDGLRKQLKAWHRNNKGLPKLTIQLVSPGLDHENVYLLKLKVPLDIENGSDGPHDLSCARISLTQLDKSIAAAERFAAETGVSPALISAASNDRK